MTTQKILQLASHVFTAQTAYAHCDYPCGIYDPHHAQLASLTVIRMVDLMTELENGHEKHDVEFRNNMMRAVNIKEQHAELVKHEIRVIWGDYFKGEMKAKYAELDGLVHEIMELGSKARQAVDRATAEQLLEKVNRFAEIFWDSKGITIQKVKAPYKPGSEIIMPVL